MVRAPGIEPGWLKRRPLYRQLRDHSVLRPDIWCGLRESNPRIRHGEPMPSRSAKATLFPPLKVFIPPFTSHSISFRALRENRTHSAGLRYRCSTLELGGHTYPVDGDTWCFVGHTYRVAADHRGVDPRYPVLETRLLAGA